MTTKRIINQEEQAKIWERMGEGALYRETLLNRPELLEGREFKSWCGVTCGCSSCHWPSEFHMDLLAAKIEDPIKAEVVKLAGRILEEEIKKRFVSPCELRIAQRKAREG